MRRATFCFVALLVLAVGWEKSASQAQTAAPPLVGTWLLVALPLLLTAFSVARPQPLPPPTLPATFDVAIAEQLARELARDYPDRSPGAPGSLGAAGWVAEQFELYGFDPQVDRFTAQIPGRGKVELQNLVTVVRGGSQRAIDLTTG